jgi:hypothetical protein
LRWSLSPGSSNSAMANTASYISVVVLSILADRTRDAGSRGFRLRLVVRLTSPRIGILTGST